MQTPDSGKPSAQGPESWVKTRLGSFTWLGPPPPARTIDHFAPYARLFCEGWISCSSSACTSPSSMFCANWEPDVAEEGTCPSAPAAGKSFQDNRSLVPRLHWHLPTSGHKASSSSDTECRGRMEGGAPGPGDALPASQGSISGPGLTLNTGKRTPS